MRAKAHILISRQLSKADEGMAMIKKIWVRLQFLRAFVTWVKDPNQTERIFQLGELARRQLKGGTPPGLKPVLEDSAFRALHTERYNPRIDLEALRKLPPETFGGTVARFLDLNGFEANAFPLIGDDTPLTYFVSRVRQTHDLWHVLTGYGTGVPSELALQGFMMAQLGSMISAMIIAGGILHTIFFKPFEMKSTFEVIVEGYVRGKRASPLLTTKLEDHWNDDIEAFRAKLGLNQEVYHATLFQNGQEDYQGAKRQLAMSV